MIILAVGDVVSTCGCEFLERKLRSLKREYNVDLCIVNGENSAKGNGLTKMSAESIFDAGADVITTGNHAFQQKNSYDYFEECPYLLRPGNYSPACPGKGFLIIEVGRQQVMVANLMGTVYMDGADNAFRIADKILQEVPEEVVVRIIDFHAEATSEKAALAHYLDGRVSAVFGTHTHVQTADECVLPNGTGFISDLGMTGPVFSILGVDPKKAIRRFLTHMPQWFETSKNSVVLHGAVFDVDEKIGKCRSVKRISFK